MLSAFVSALRTPDLRRKILFTLGLIALYRLGATRAVPGVDYGNVQSVHRPGRPVATHAGIYSLINLFSGGALLQLSVFAIGIMPYITASIIVQLLTVVIPRFEELRKEGQSGQAKMTQYTRYLSDRAGGPAGDRHRRSRARGQLLQGCSRADPRRRQSIFGLVIIVLVMTAGAAVVMWFGELITERGVGNGMSLLIFAGIASRIPTEGKSILDSRGGLVFALVCVAALVDHRRRRLRRAGPAPDPGAVRQAHGRPPDVRRFVDVPAAEGQPGRRHPGDLRVVAAVPAEPDRAADRREYRGRPELVAAHHQHVPGEPEQPGLHLDLLRA